MDKSTGNWLTALWHGVGTSPHLECKEDKGDNCGF